MKLDNFGRSSFVIYVIVALVGAAVLVLYLHHRAIAMFERQTELVFQKVSEVTGERLVSQIQNTFEGSVLDTLWAPERPYGRLGNVIKAGRIDILERRYAEGLTRYPQIERFFLWARPRHGLPDRGGMLFYGGAAERQATFKSFYHDPALGQVIAELAHQYADGSQEFVAAERQVGERTYAIVIRRFWNEDDQGRRLGQDFALLGFIVNLDRVRTTLFPELHRTALRQLLEPSDGSPRLEMRVFDDIGRQVFGPPGVPTSTAATMRFALRFYPPDIQSRMASTVPIRFWTLVVNPTPGSLPAQVRSTATGIYWLSGLSLSLMLVALVFAVKGIGQVLELSRMQSDFVAHVSHQLKTPLSVLSVASETLSLGRIRSEAKTSEYLAIVCSETSRLSGMVDRILEFSRHDGRHRAYEFETVNLVPLVRQCIDGFLRVRPESDISIAFVHGETDGLPVISADPAALEQVLLNLLDNAARYSPRVRDVTVRISQLGREVILEVVDKGIGIDAADAKHVFERFYRGAAAPLNRHGFGLGLAIVRQIVNAHSGTVEVESTAGQGSTFRVRLPLSHGGGRRPIQFWTMLRNLRGARTS